MTHLNYDSQFAGFMAEAFLQNLRSFSFFDESHRILCATLEDGYSLAHWTRETQNRRRSNKN